MNRYKKIVSYICVLCLMSGMLPVRTNATTVEEIPIIAEETVAMQVTAQEENSVLKVEETQPLEPDEESKIETDEQGAEEETPISSYLEIPLYYQTDYPETTYGKGSIATNGSSITALAMVATYMTGYEYLPDELAQYFDDSGDNNIQRLEAGSEALQLSFEKSENFDKTMAALREGKVAIAVMEAPSLFTTSQHFIVLTGLNEDGKILVHDSYEPNYEKWDLERAFAEGFAEGDILYGYRGAWIYDKSDMPEEPFLYSEAESEQEEVPVIEEKEPADEEVSVPDEETVTAQETIPTEDSVLEVEEEGSIQTLETEEKSESEEETVTDSDVEVSEGENAVASYEEIPLYFQTDYPEVMFGTGSIASSGCSITALAMVATYMTGHEYLPDELARYFGGTAENNIKRLEIGSETMQLPFEKSENFDITMAALREGKVAIALMEGSSLFTDTQHFIVLTGLNEDGKIMVRDPYEPNYERWDLKRAFVEGFDEGDILCGYSGAWIYDKSAMPEEPFLYSEPEPERGEPRYPHIQLTLEEKQLLARVVWVEAQGESLEGQQAVAEVVLNRMASDEYSDSLKGVIYAENQFRSVPFLEDAQPYQAQYEAIESAIYGPYVLPEDVVHFATYAVNGNVWGRIGGHIFCHG